MYRSIVSLIATALLVAPAVAQNEFQLMVDTLSGSTHTMKRMVVTDEGAIVLAFPSPTGTTFWVADEDGTPQSSFHLNYPAYDRLTFDMVSRPGGGILVVSRIDEVIETPGSLQDDTARVRLIVSSLTIQGTLHWSKEYVIDRLFGEFGVGAYPELLTLKASPSGYFLCVQHLEGIWDAINILKLSPGGNLLWSRELDGLADHLPFRIAPSDDGGLFIAQREFDAANTAVFMGKLDAAGEPVWMRKFNYANNAITMELNDLVVGANGGPIAVSDMSGYGWNYGYLLALSPDGGQFEGHFYETSGTIRPGFRDAILLPNGDLYICTGGPWDTTNDFMMLRLAPDLTVQESLGTQGQLQGQLLHSMRSVSLARINDHVLVAGSMRSVHQIFGTVEHRPSIWRLDLANNSGCLVTDPVVMHHPIPADLIVVTDINAASVPYMAVASDAPDPFTAYSLLATMEVCDLLVGLDEQAPLRSVFTVTPNPSHGGDPVMVQCPNAAIYDVFSATGSLVLSGIRADGQGRATLDLGSRSGTYVAVARDAMGNAIARERVVLL